MATLSLFVSFINYSAISINSFYEQFGINLVSPYPK